MGTEDTQKTPKSVMEGRQTVLRALSRTQNTQKNGKAQSPSGFWLKTIPFFIFIILVGSVFLVYEGLFYISAWEKGATKIAKLVHFPVAFVSKNTISINQLEEEKATLALYYSHAAKTDATIVVTPNLYEQTALTKLIRDTVLKDAASKYKIKISEADIETAFRSLFGTDSASLDGNRLANEASGLTSKQFKQTILYDTLLQQKISVQLVADTNLLQQKKEKAQKIADAIHQNPSVFDEYLSKSAEGVIARDIGFRNVQTISSLFVGLKDMQIGAVSQLLESDAGFHVMRLAGVVPEGSTGDAIEYIHLEEILVNKPNFSEWIRDNLSDLHIVVLNPELTWNSVCDRIIQKNETCTSAYDNLQKNQLEEQINQLIKPKQ